jgi:hypothetical protein
LPSLRPRAPSDFISNTPSNGGDASMLPVVKLRRLDERAGSNRNQKESLKGISADRAIRR